MDLDDGKQEGEAGLGHPEAVMPKVQESQSETSNIKKLGYNLSVSCSRCCHMLEVRPVLELMLANNLLKNVLTF